MPFKFKEIDQDLPTFRELEEDEFTYEEEYCSSCGGSGEGPACGTRCSSCEGEGVVTIKIPIINNEV